MNGFVTTARKAGGSFIRRSRISRRMIIAAFALLIALIASYLAFRYLNYRERDNPELMKKYISYFDPDFLGLTGSDDQVSKAATAYGATFERFIIRERIGMCTS
jgi:hypothetical protein